MARIRLETAYDAHVTAQKHLPDLCSWKSDTPWFCFVKSSRILSFSFDLRGKKTRTWRHAKNESFYGPESMEMAVTRSWNKKGQPNPKIQPSWFFRKQDRGDWRTNVDFWSGINLYWHIAATQRVSQSFHTEQKTRSWSHTNLKQTSTIPLISSKLYETWWMHIVYSIHKGVVERDNHKNYSRAAHFDKLNT